MSRALLIPLLLSLVAAGPLAAQEAPEQGLVVRATGKGYAPKGKTGKIAELMARRAAKMVAMRNLLAKLGRLAPKGDGTGWLQGYLRGVRVVSEKAREDGGWDVTVELPVSSVVMRLRLENKELKATIARQKTEIKRLNKLVEALSAKLKLMGEQLGALTTQIRACLKHLKGLLPLDKVEQPRRKNWRDNDKGGEK